MSDATQSPRPGDNRLRTRAITVLALVAGVAALRASYPVTMPLAFALIIVAAIWPIRPWLDARLPRWASYLATVATLLVGLGLFAFAIYFAVAEVIRALLRHAAEIEAAWQAIVAWADRNGVPLSPSGQVSGFSYLRGAVTHAYSFLGYLGLIAVLVAFGLPEVARLRGELARELKAESRREVLASVGEIGDKIRSYFGVTVTTSLLTGFASAGWSLAMGLELAGTWGVLNFLLNFIPVIGNIIGILPPTLYAWLQFQDRGTTLLVFTGFAVLQLAISNFIYPQLQGRSLSLSPFAIVVALTFWSWLWGIGGALIAIPLTVALVIVCDAFPRSRWMARLLSRG